MLFHKLTSIFLSIVFLILLNGCATVFSRYEDTIDLKNAPEDIRVYDTNGVEMSVSERRDIQYSNDTRKYEPALIKTISLRKNKEHVLVLKSGDREKRIMVYPKIGAGWLVVDLITGIFPIFVDAYTGNWNYFEEINAGF